MDVQRELDFGSARRVPQGLLLADSPRATFFSSEVHGHNVGFVLGVYKTLLPGVSAFGENKPYLALGREKFGNVALDPKKIGDKIGFGPGLTFQGRRDDYAVFGVSAQEVATGGPQILYTLQGLLGSIAANQEGVFLPDTRKQGFDLKMNFTSDLKHTQVEIVIAPWVANWLRNQSEGKTLPVVSAAMSTTYLEILASLGGREPAPWMRRDEFKAIVTGGSIYLAVQGGPATLSVSRGSPLHPGWGQSLEARGVNNMMQVFSLLGGLGTLCNLIEADLKNSTSLNPIAA